MEIGLNGRTRAGRAKRPRQRYLDLARVWVCAFKSIRSTSFSVDSRPCGLKPDYLFGSDAQRPIFGLNYVLKAGGWRYGRRRGKRRPPHSSITSIKDRTSFTRRGERPGRSGALSIWRVRNGHPSHSGAPEEDVGSKITTIII